MLPWSRGGETGFDRVLVELELPVEFVRNSLKTGKNITATTANALAA